jgi:raffinose/stachyose/melibiose transport system substrate-binding protein
MVMVRRHAGRGSRWGAAGLAAALVLTACGNGGDDVAANGNGEDDGEEAVSDGESDVTLRVGIWTDVAPVLDELAEGFEEETGIEVEYSPTDVDTYQTTVRTELNSGTAPDVLGMWPGDGNPMALNVVHEFLADLSDEPWVEEVPEAFVDLTEHEGEQKAISLSTAFIGLIRNVDVFEEHGWEVPRTWTETLELCETINDEGLIPMALALQTPWQTQIATYGLVPTTVYEETPDWNQQRLDGEVTFADSGWSEALEKYLELEERGCFNDDALGTEYDGALQMVGTGEAAAMIQISSGLPQMAEYGEDVAFEMTPVAASEDPDEVWASAAAGTTFGVNAEADHPEEARELLRYLWENVDEVAEAVAAVPAFPTEAEPDPQLAEMAEMLEAGRSASFPDQQWPNPEVQQVHFAEIQRLFTGDTTVEDALGEMDEAFDADS